MNQKIIDQLKLPLPYLFQEYHDSPEKLTHFKDNYGFSFMHWAVALENKDKVVELLEFEFPYNIQSLDNHLPEEIYMDVDSRRLSQEIFFTEGGFTPLHLNVFLHHFYFMLQQEDKKGAFNFKKLAEKQQEIFTHFCKNYKDALSLQDNSLFSVTDYCFLCEDFALIEIIHHYDNLFDSLKRLKLETAYQTILCAEKRTQVTQVQDAVKKSLKSRILKEKLESDIDSHDTSMVESYNEPLQKI
jgi:hypothetical protein